jgi:mutator protein MutT
MNDDPSRPIRVGIGLIRRGGRFLIRLRPAGTAMAGYWEFPGGKCEPGEAPDKATLRECREETGLEIVLGTLRSVITHRYPHAWVDISYFNCGTHEMGSEPDPASGFLWVAAGELCSLRFPEANAPILEALAREFSPTG